MQQSEGKGRQRQIDHNKSLTDMSKKNKIQDMQETEAETRQNTSQQIKILDKRDAGRLKERDAKKKKQGKASSI